MSINAFALSGLLVAIFSLSLTFIALVSGKGTLHRLLALFNFVVFLWGAGNFLVGIATNTEAALWGWQYAYAGGFFIAVVFYHLVCRYCQIDRPTIIAFGYLQGVVFNILSFATHLMIDRVRLVYGIYYLDHDLFYAFAVAIFLGYVALSFYELLRFIINAKAHVRRQAIFVCVAFLIGFLSGLSTLLPSFRIDLFYPLGNVGICVYVSILTYAMLRHRLFDMETIVLELQREKLASAGLLAACITHEIRSPLYTAKNMLESCVEKIGKASEQEIKSTLEKSIVYLSRTSNVAQKLSEFMRRKESAEVYTQKAGDVAETVRVIFNLLSLQPESKTVELIQNIPDDLPRARISSGELEQILLNLSTNALHAMPEGGRLSLNASCSNGKIVITISDTGKGISKNNLTHIFEPLYSTKGDGGMGLGLYITKMLVERNKGNLSVASSPEAGTTFTVSLPTAKEKAYARRA